MAKNGNTSVGDQTDLELFSLAQKELLLMNPKSGKQMLSCVTQQSLRMVQTLIVIISFQIILQMNNINLANFFVGWRWNVLL